MQPRQPRAQFASHDGGGSPLCQPQRRRTHAARSTTNFQTLLRRCVNMCDIRHSLRASGVVDDMLRARLQEEGEKQTETQWRISAARAGVQVPEKS